MQTSLIPDQFKGLYRNRSVIDTRALAKSNKYGVQIGYRFRTSIMDRRGFRDVHTVEFKHNYLCSNLYLNNLNIQDPSKTIDSNELIHRSSHTFVMLSPNTQWGLGKYGNISLVMDDVLQLYPVKVKPKWIVTHPLSQTQTIIGYTDFDYIGGCNRLSFGTVINNGFGEGKLTINILYSRDYPPISETHFQSLDRVKRIDYWFGI